jgi:hypothetical protein
MQSAKLAKMLIAGVWAGLLCYAFTLAPPNDAAVTHKLLAGSVSGSFSGIDPAVVAVWNLLGVVPLLYLSLLVPDGRRQRVLSWPFGLLMMVGGGFILVPWLLLRSEQPSATRPFRLGMRVVRSATYRWGIVVAIVGLCGYGLGAGSVSGFAKLFWQARLVHVMTLDLLLCAALLPYLIGKLRRPDDVASEPSWARLLLLLPLLGPALWSALYYRPVPLDR